MPIITSLLRRAQANAAGVYVDRAWENAPDAERSPLEQSWHAWKEAHVAFEGNDLRSASGWLRAAEERLAAHDDALCRVEVETTWMRLADRVEEPREAAGYASSAWSHWYALASSPSPAEAVPSIRALLTALAPEEDTASLDDSRLFVEWLSDRLGPSLQSVFRATMRLYGRLGLTDDALAVAAQMRSFFDRNLAHVPANVRGVSYADLQESVGNLLDQTGDLEASYQAFAEGVELLDGAPDRPDVQQLRARLSFNAANELSKMGRYGEATPHFARALEAFVQLGAAEPALRARHALLVNRFKAGDGDRATLRAEVEAIAVEYESLDDGGDAVRQNLDSAYRLWLTLAAPDTHDDAKLTHRFLGQLYALREGLGTFARDWASGPARATSQVILSEVAVLGARLGRLENAVLLVLESGVDRVVLTTIRSGDEPLAARVRTAVGGDALAPALESMVQSYRAATEDLIQRTLPVKSEPGDELMAACQATWDALPEEIRDEIAAADTVFAMPSNAGSMDEVPVELIHDGADFLGTRASVVRTSSLKQLVATLGSNRVNVPSSAKAVVVQAGDVDELGALPDAAEEAELVAKALDAPERDIAWLTDPTFDALSGELGTGADVLHFIGHGFADENGEMLVLGAGDDQRARAIDLRAIGPAPAPVCIMSSCELGRSRHLQSGEQQGVVVALLEAGAPAVVAATYSVPDVVGRQFAQALYRRAGKSPLGEAVRGARRALAKSGVHPAAWGSFVMFGDPAAPLFRVPRDVDALDWPACLVRLAATGAATYADAVRARIGDDARLTADQREHIIQSVEALEEGDGSAFPTEVIRSNPLLELDAESYLSYHVLLSAGALRFALKDGVSDDERRSILSFLLRIRPMLEDSYLRALIARECSGDVELILTTDQGRAILASGVRALAWLAADAGALQETAQTLNAMDETSRRAVAFNAQEMIGLGAETYQRADEGDRQAQKRLVRELFTRRASVAALSSDEPWTTWMLRMIACGTEQSICDLFGVIDESRKARRISAQEAGALDELIEQFIGPGEVAEETAALVTSVFESKPLEREVIALFLAHDRLASGSPDVTTGEIAQSVQRAEAIGSEAALTFFLGVWAQYAAQAGALEQAIGAARGAVTLAAKIAATDAELQDRLGRTALLLSQLYQYAGEPALAAAVQMEHYDAVRAHLDRAEGGGPASESQGDESAARPPIPPGVTPGFTASPPTPRSATPPAG